MALSYFKALHLIFMVTWFAGLFYIVRIFVYHAEAEKKEEPDRSILIKQYQLMERRAWYIISWPAMILTIGCGIGMLVVNSVYLKQPWMHLKLAFVFGLVLYHIYNHVIFQKFQKGESKMTSMKMRMWNEVATLLLFTIVFIATVGRLDLSNWIWGVVGLLIIAILMMVAIKWYKKARAKKE